MGVDHKPGFLKQTNKTHKTGGHKSKRAIDNEAKGKISVKSLSRTQTILSREERRLRGNHIRKNKREEVFEKKRAIGSHDLNTAPFLTVVITLNEAIDPLSAVSLITNCDAEAFVTTIQRSVTHISVPRFKQKFSFVCPRLEKGSEYFILDCLKVCDSVIFVASAAFPDDDIVDKWGQKILNMAMAQGVALPIVALMDLESIAPKKRTITKTFIQKIINKTLPDEKIMSLETNADGLNVLRRIGAQKRKILHNKVNRPHIYCENVSFLPDVTDNSKGTLQCTGYLRGVPMSANNLCYVPCLGDYQISKIEAPMQDPFKNQDKSDSKEDMAATNLLFVADPLKRTNLIRENKPDPMDAEQTWPTEEEIAQSNSETKKIKLVKRIPKGMSDYQACWIPDIEEVEEDSDESQDEKEENYMSCESDDDSDQNQNESEDENEGIIDSDTVSEAPVNDEKYDKEMDFEEEQKTLQKLKQERIDAMFPDEIDTPMEVPARLRFRKYRGLESFRTSPWDSKENLPDDYARIFQFENFNRTKQRILKEAKDTDGALPGWFITIHIIGVNTADWEKYKQLNNTENMIVYGVLEHEHQMSVMNVVLKRTPNSTIPIASKERLIVQCGYRRFFVNPIFSQHTNGDKHKFERYFRPHTTVVATFYAPIQYPPAPILCFRENPDSSITLIASGSLLDCNPNRIVLKRVVLSGNPYKIHKKSATIRYMFFNKEDIQYFKPCKLRTKCGRSGHIQESLGTHGHMKVVFDGPLKSYDSVFLYLYKRIFSKWTYEDYTVNSSTMSNNTEKMQE